MQRVPKGRSDCRALFLTQPRLNPADISASTPRVDSKASDFYSTIFPMVSFVGLGDRMAENKANGTRRGRARRSARVSTPPF